MPCSTGRPATDTSPSARADTASAPAWPPWPPWRLRLATPDDVPALAALYATTARTLGPWCYSPEQVAAWASFGADLAGFADYVLEADTWLAEQAADAAPSGGQRPAPGTAPGLLGFSGIDSAGEVKSLYVRHDITRQGLASHLLAHGLARARARGIRHFAACATPFSLPVFQRAQFVLVQRVRAEFAGAMFERIRVATPASFVEPTSVDKPLTP